ncbi:radical SAM/SPASM domain-containing protein [Maridesulfovibrio sp.]|uniref:radical SAM/SPASM domain-containing protein n=1 Tax=Maridesulfovibrio sp. TaxID=2795000 RepID=UPI002AA65CAB|nr:radical SAM protein [Maridesulfovibrio sp.]
MRSYTFLMKISEYCPLNCRYCYTENSVSNFMDIKLVGHTVRFVNNSEEIDAARFVWHGAEPLAVGGGKLNDFICYVKDHCEKQVQFSIQSNAVLIDNSIIDILKENKVSVGVSIDGTQGVHNFHRPYKDGRESYSRVLSNLIEMKDAGIDVSCICVLSKISIGYLADIYSFFKRHELPVRFSPIRPYGGAQGCKLTPAKEEAAEIMCALFDMWAQDQSDHGCVLVDALEVIGNILGNKPSLCTFAKNCQDGILCVTVNGKLVPCTDFHGAHYSYGNIADLNSLSDVLSSSVYKQFSRRCFSRGKCHDCEFWEFCFKGCPYRAIECGDFTDRDPEECYVNRIFFSHVTDRVLSSINKE